MSIAMQASGRSIAAAARSAIAWLARVDTERWADDPGVVVDALAVSRVCRLLCRDVGSLADTVGARIARACPTPIWTASNLLPGLIAATGALGVETVAARSAKEYLLMLEELQPASLKGPNDILVRMALHGADRGASLAASIAVMPAAALLEGGPDQIRKLLAAIELSSAFGIKPIGVEPPVPILIEGAALAAFRAYDLPLGMRLLRAARYLCTGPSTGMSVGLDFLRFSQCDDGSFGDYDTALAQMAARGDPNGALHLKLPVTLQALWTMAELEDPSFRLVRSAFPRAALTEPNGISG